MDNSAIEIEIIECEAFVEHRNRWFRTVTCTKPADRETAQDAACALTELVGIKTRQCVWADSPKEAKSIWRASFNSSANAFSGSLSASLRCSLGETVGDWLVETLKCRLDVPLHKGASGLVSARSSAALGKALGEPTWYSLDEEFRRKLKGWTDGSIWPSQWAAMHTFLPKLGVKHAPESARALGLIEKLLQACFACWVGVEEVFLCERPSAATIEDGKLRTLSWVDARRDIECTSENPCLDYENCPNCKTFPSGSGG